MKQDKFLVGIIIGIGVLILVAIGLFFTRKSTVLTYQSEDQPQGVVYNYILALRNEDYTKAYGYLAEKPGKPTIAVFRQGVLLNKEAARLAVVDLGSANVEADLAYVEVSFTNSYNDGIFANSYENKENAVLERAGGEWKITMMPYLFWSFDWYQVFK